MTESATIVTLVEPPQCDCSRPARALPSARLLPVRQLTRAHLMVARRPAVVRAALATLDAIALDLAQHLGVPVRLEARLLDATVHPLAQFGNEGAFVVLELGALGAMAVLELDGASAGALLQHAAGGGDGCVAPLSLTRIEEAALGWAALSALAVVRTNPDVQRRFGPRLVSVLTQRHEVLQRLDCRLRHVAIELNVGIGVRSGSARLLVPADALASAALDAPEELPGEVAATVSAATIEARCLVGRVLLEPCDAAALVPGDVVIFPSVTSTGDRLLGGSRFLTSLFELTGELSPDGLTLTRAQARTPTKDNAMSAADEPLAVEVEIELARVRLPVSELGTLRAGTVLPLHISATQPVLLRLGDKTFARAELVDIEGEIGARIVALV